MHIKIIFNFNKNCKNLFKKLKNYFIYIFILIYYNLNKKFHLKINIFNKIITTIFFQKNNNNY